MSIFGNDPIKQHNKMVSKQKHQTKDEPKVDSISYFDKRHLTNFSDDILPIMKGLQSRQLYGRGNQWLHIFMNGPTNDPSKYTVSFLNDIVDQNYAILHELDRHNQYQKTIIEQNEIIIRLLKEGLR